MATHSTPESHLQPQQHDTNAQEIAGREIKYRKGRARFCPMDLIEQVARTEIPVIRTHAVVDRGNAPEKVPPGTLPERAWLLCLSHPRNLFLLKVNVPPQ